MAGFPDVSESLVPLWHHSLLKNNYSSKTPKKQGNIKYNLI